VAFGAVLVVERAQKAREPDSILLPWYRPLLGWLIITLLIGGLWFASLLGLKKPNKSRQQQRQRIAVSEGVPAMP